ncbi:calcium-binding protein [Vibrio sp. THAF190c]|uniref:calcium-binding protein n=1 Tax=Vibrio sp. THAF190c TaxID=2587865 RepID=UPI001267C3FB|nr:calcium-binding protein [Vibrio sp. THAF190c]QFT09347.1 Hemolysin, chromosomal [Vibrio sp. THAF190c]
MAIQLTNNVTGTSAEETNTNKVAVPNRDQSQNDVQEPIILGSDGLDAIRAGKGNDIVAGFGGDDFIASGRGSDVVYAGDGNDVVESWNHSINAKDEAGELSLPEAMRTKDVGIIDCVDDVIIAGAGNDYVEGGGNNDAIYGDRGGHTFGENLITNGTFNVTETDAKAGGPGLDGSWGTYATIEGWEADNDNNGVDDSPEGLMEIQFVRVGGAPTGEHPTDDGDSEGESTPSNVLELDSHNHAGIGSDQTNTTASTSFTVSPDALGRGGTFQLTFDYANRHRGEETNTSPFQVLIDGEVVAEYQNDGTGLDHKWYDAKLNLDLEAGEHTLSFRAIDNEQTEDTYGALIANVELYQYEANDFLVGDGTPRDTDGNWDQHSEAGDDLIRGGKGDDIIIGDSFNPLYYDEDQSAFFLDFDNTYSDEEDNSVTLSSTDNLSGYGPDGEPAIVSVTTGGNVKAGGTGYGVTGVPESGVNAQIGLSYDDNGDVIGSEMLSVSLDEHTMAAKVGISNLYLNEGGSGIHETGHWAAYREGLLVAEGDFTANDLVQDDGVTSSTSNNNGYLIISPIDTGFKAFDELQFTAIGEVFDKNGNQVADDSSDFYVTSVDSLELSGEGTDYLVGGHGNDVILGGHNSNSTPTLNDNGTYSLSNFSGTLSITLESSEAGFNNSYGYYTIDDKGEVSIDVVWGNVHDALDNAEDGKPSFDLSIGHCIETLGFFIIPDGGDKGVTNDSELNFNIADLESNSSVNTTSDTNANITVVAGNNLLSVVFDSLDDAPNQYSGNPGEGNQHFNDNPNSGDSDFDDVVTTVGLEADKETLRGGKGDDWLDGGADNDLIQGGKGDDSVIGGSGDDMLRGGKGDDIVLGGSGDDTLNGGHGDDHLNGGSGDDVLKGGKGDDVLDGGEGSDVIKAGKGNDTVVYDAADSVIHGGKGFDVLKADNQGPVDIDMSKGESINGFEAVIGSDDVSDKVTLSLGKTFNQNFDLDGNRSKNGDSDTYIDSSPDFEIASGTNHVAEFFALGIEEIDIQDFQGFSFMSSGTVTLEEEMRDKLGLDGTEVITAYSFTKGDKEVVIYTDALLNENFDPMV